MTDDLALPIWFDDDGPVAAAGLQPGHREGSIDGLLATVRVHPVEAGKHFEHVAHLQGDVEVALLRADAHP